MSSPPVSYIKKEGPAHALLSASSSHRWLSCPPSARLSQNYEDRKAIILLKEQPPICSVSTVENCARYESERSTPDLTYYNHEMEECADGYVAFILELIETAKKPVLCPIVLIEQRLDYSKYAQGGFGTGDCIIAGDGLLYIVDYKHGQGVLVDAEKNPQMMLYGLGALEIFDCLFDIDTVSMTIYQPRRNNISTYTAAKEDLYHWAEEELKPRAILAYAGGGEFLCGEWCQFCKAKHECRARAQHNMALAQYDFKLPPLLEDHEVEDVLAKIGHLVSWANDIKAYALQAALGGKEWKGWKLVEGRSIRKYKNEDAVAQAVHRAGYDPYEKRLKGIIAMEKCLGKAKFSGLLGNLVEKPRANRHWCRQMISARSLIRPNKISRRRYK